MKEERIAVMEFVKKRTLKNPEEINNDTLIFQEDYLDSMGFLILVDYLETQYGIEINDEDKIVENFESINAIINYLQSKLK